MSDLNNTPDVVETLPADAPKAPKRRGRSTAVREWWWVRISAAMLVPLSVWFVVSVFSQLIGASALTLSQWLASPFVALALMLMLGMGFIHARLGLHEIVVDYVHAPAKKKTTILLVDLVSLGFALASIAAVVHLHLAASS